MMDTKRRTLLIGLVLLPIFYFGMQLLLAPAYPGYSLLRDPTSELGSDRSPVALWFNLLAVVGGALGMAGAWGALYALRDAGGSLVQALILPAIVAVVAAGSIWAGVFPMPHPLHPMNPATPAMLITPLAALIYAWWAAPLRPLRRLLSVNLVAFLVILPFMMGLVPIDRGALGGLLQRLLALPIFVSIGLIGWQLRRSSL
jgi:hypothetical membrane protein